MQVTGTKYLTNIEKGPQKCRENGSRTKKNKKEEDGDLLTPVRKGKEGNFVVFKINNI